LQYLKFPKVLLDLDAKIPGILLNCRDKCPLVQGKKQHCPRLTGEESAQLKAIFRLLLQTCHSLKKKCIVVNAGGSKMRGIFNGIVPSDDVLKLDSVHFSMYNYHNHKCYSNASDQKFVLSSIISGMDDQLKTFLVDIRPLNLPSLIDHMSHCRMITSIVPASGVGRFVQDCPAIYVSKRIYKQFTHEECSRGGKNSITKRKLDMKKYIADCSAGGKNSITKQKLDMKKFIADCSAGGITGGKNLSANLQAILKVTSGVEQYCAYCGTPRFFRENVALLGVCMNGDCPSRHLNYNQHRNWRKTKPSEREMKHFIFAQSKTMYQCINCKQVVSTSSKKKSIKLRCKVCGTYHRKWKKM
jgi:DNA-directed RNA polymerase subunit RPC12/RpoP